MNDASQTVDWSMNSPESQAALLKQYTANPSLGAIQGLPTNPYDPNSASLGYSQGAYQYDGYNGQPVWQNGQIVGYDFVKHDAAPGFQDVMRTDASGNISDKFRSTEGESITLADAVRMAATMYGVSTGLNGLFGGLGAGAAGAGMTAEQLAAVNGLGGAEVAGGLSAAEASAAGLGGGFTGAAGGLAGAGNGAWLGDTETLNAVDTLNGSGNGAFLGATEDMAVGGAGGSTGGAVAGATGGVATGGAATGAGGLSGAASGAGAAGTAGGLAGAANTASNISTGLKVAGAVGGLAGAAGADTGGGIDSTAATGGQSLIDLANTTARNNLDMAKYTTNANRFNQSNQYGDSTWTYTPTYDANGKETGGGWSQKTTLNPAQQALFNSQTAGNQGLSDTANTALRNSSQLSNPNLDLSKLPAYQGLNLNALPSAPITPGMTAQQAAMSRLQPTLNQYDNALSQRLANQGLTLGSEAYNREMNLAGQKRNDLELQAAYQGISLDQAARQQALGEQQALYNQTSSQRGQMLNEQQSAINTPLNTINALRSGSQVSNPQFQNLNYNQANVAGSDVLGAGQAQQANATSANNAQRASNAGIFGGLAQLGTAAALAPAGTFSGLFG